MVEPEFLARRGYPWVIVKLTPLLDNHNTSLDNEYGLDSVKFTHEDEEGNAF